MWWHIALAVCGGILALFAIGTGLWLLRVLHLRSHAAYAEVEIEPRISTPYGSLSYRDINAEMLDRARNREYYLKGRVP